MSTNTQTKVMTIAEAAKELGISRNGAYLAVQRGDLPAIRIGRTLRVPRIAIEKLLEGTTAMAVK